MTTDEADDRYEVIQDRLAKARERSALEQPYTVEIELADAHEVDIEVALQPTVQPIHGG
jgi:hypothetical protein